MPEPILVAIAAALAAKSATGIYDLVKRKFAKDQAATAALEAATTSPDHTQPIQVLAERLHQAKPHDEQFADALRAEWRKLPESRTTHGGVHNRISGSVSGKVVQAGEVHGNIGL
ncbi:hypothetical protein [Amycolatopsis sp. H20-H5]|uniref:hypothetical protein n=1 Tax=Amycolatopsis sp. H20-H5 TaxID=3046309 RepID=UPI002DC04D0F|nr:hypothetical protein [Amycolatopsis sp. H20-H5]MEC3979821.1 hypothetical protein [Amycolatopsis sp. H20-H5]